MSKETTISRRALLGLTGLAALGYAVYDDKVNNAGESYEDTREKVAQELQRQRTTIASRHELDAEQRVLGKTDTQYKIDHPDELMAALKTKRKVEIEQQAFARRRSEPGVSVSGYKLAGDIMIGAAGALALMSAIKPVRGSSR